MPVYPGAHNRQRPHRALDLKPPNPADPALPASGEIQRRDRLGGLIHEYYRAAA
jgi:putative transposase